MNLTKFINIPVFAISFAIGVFVIYYIGFNQMRKIYVYPTPDNIDALQYKDHANNCFTVKHTPVQCPIDGSQTHKIPVAV
jgi:hypothetical protein